MVKYKQAVFSLFLQFNILHLLQCYIHLFIYLINMLTSGTIITYFKVLSQILPRL